ncbi:MAG: histidine phosphatase family protein [Acidimicrobiales bacterium]|nr:MAG: histidine phosphatase family protein [Acidimicrobiales bacterium]
MVELLVMRHAKSDWNSGASRDFDRPLADRGHRAAERMAQWLEDQDLQPDRVVSSSAVRARATAAYIVEHLEIADTDVEFRDDLYHADVEDWLAVLREQSAERILICGHNPGLDWLVEFLADSSPPETADGKLMTTAAIAHLSFDGGWQSVSESAGQLQSLVRPRELRPS